MKHILRAVSGVALVVAAAAPATTGSAAAASGQAQVRDVCGPAPAGSARCLAEVREDVHGGYGLRGAAADAAAPTGYGPADLRSAYDLPTKGGSGQTVALVDVGDDTHAEADLAVYRKTYGLPACTTTNGCFRKVNQKGKASPLPADAGWGIEIGLDLDMVSAACSTCHILLVESDAAAVTSLAKAEDTAAALGATEISNSYGSAEGSGSSAVAASYSHPGVAITVSSGDSGYGVPSAPAVYQSVIAVGGTSLKRANNSRGWSESAWGTADGSGGGSGSGCSAWVAKPSWQHDPNCPGRMTADVAADADPLTGPAMYATVDGGTGWLQVGGTSASSPFIAGVIGLAGNPSRFLNASYLYTHHSALHDIATGNNVLYIDCGGDYQCNAVVGYDGPTGLGTPNGVGDF